MQRGGRVTQWILCIAAIFGMMSAGSVLAATQAISFDAQGNLVSATTTAAAASPTIIAQPVGQLSRPGKRVSFSVVAAGTPPLSYQWRFNGTPIPTASNATAGTSTLVLSSIGSGDFGAYSVTVANGTGSLTSAAAQLQLDSVGDGIPDAWKAANFGSGWAANPNAAADADPDGDGFTNAEEYADGTNPNSAASHFFRLTITGGNVAVQPAAARYAPGTVVTLTALSSGDQQFTNFTTQDLIANTPAVSTTANPLVLTLNTNYAVSASYGSLPLDRPAVPPSFTVNIHNARVEAFLTQADGKLLIAGSFDSVAGGARSNIARFNSNGSLDLAFNPSIAGGIVNMVQQSDGKLLIAGYFSAVNGVARSGLARLNSDGSLDTTFTANCDNFVRQVAYRASDGKIMAAGAFLHVNGVLSPGVARLNADGSVDTGFAVGSGANSTVWSVVWQPDGTAVIGGDFTSFNGTTVARLARLTASGAIDPAFTASADSTVFQIARRPSDGDLWVAGNFAAIDGVSRRGLARLRASNGGLDTSVNQGAGLVNGGVGSSGLALQADGKVVIGGTFQGYNGSTQANIARVQQDGTLDTGYSLGAGAGLDSIILGVGLDSAGNTLLGGYFNFINGIPHLGIARLLAASGNLDANYTRNVSYYSQVYSLVSQPDGAILAGGTFNVVNGIYRAFAARLRSDGSLDTTFNPGLGCSDVVDSVAVGPDGKIVIGGRFISVNGQAAQRVARFNAAGSLDSSFQNVVATDEVFAVAVQRDGKVLAGGYFTSVGGEQHQRLARIEPDGTPDSDFTPILDARALAIVVQPDAKILIGGEFTVCDGVATGSIARLNPDGTLDDGFTPPQPNDRTDALALQPDGKFIAAGRFTTLLGGTRIANRVARFNPDGTLDPNFSLGTNFGANGEVFSVALQSDGHIVLGGNFSGINTISRYAIARLEPDGSLDTSASFNQATLALNNFIYTVAVQPSDATLAGGAFNAVGDQPRLAFVRFLTASTLQTGAITVSPAGPVFASGATVTLSLTPVTTGAPVASVGFEMSADGVHFTSVGNATPGAAGAWVLSGVALPPGASFFRAVVTDQAAALVRSNLAGPFVTPPVVTGPFTATGTAGLPFTLQVNATGPLTGFTASGLPAGLSAAYDADLGALVISGTPTAAGVSSVTLAPANAAGGTAASLTLTISNRYDAWAAQNFTAAELNNPNLSGPLGDATGAGISNLLKYALGIPPHAAGIPAGLPVAGIQSFGGINYLTLTYTHDPSATDVALTVEVSSDLITWNSGPGFTVEVSRVANANGSETVVTRDALPQVSAPRRFIRLRVTQIAP